MVNWLVNIGAFSWLDLEDPIWGPGPRCLQDVEGFLCPPGWSAETRGNPFGRALFSCFFGMCEICSPCITKLSFGWSSSLSSSTGSPIVWVFFSRQWHQANWINDLKSLKRSLKHHWKIIEKNITIFPELKNHFKKHRGPIGGLARDEGLAESQLYCLVANGITGLAQENVRGEA